jgi:hypothetical protein
MIEKRAGGEVAEGGAMTEQSEEASPACGRHDGICYKSENGGFRMWCFFCGHSSTLQASIGLARREWLGRREQPSV